MINIHFGDNVQADVPAILFIIVNLIDLLQTSASAILPPPHVLYFYTTAIDYRVSSSRQNPSTAQHHVHALHVLLMTLNNAIVTAQPPVAQIPVAPVVPRHSAPPAAPIPKPPMGSSDYGISVQYIVDANPNGDTDVYTNMLDLLERLSLKEKPAVFAELLATVCTAARGDYLYGSCTSLLEQYNTGDFCIDCNAERLPGTGHHESWQYGLCTDCIAARNSGVAPIPVGSSPVARQAPSPAAPHPADAPPRCSMCDNGKYPSIYKICWHMPPVCIRCLETAQFLGKEFCGKDNSVFCEKCRIIHPYTPRH